MIRRALERFRVSPRSLVGRILELTAVWLPPLAFAVLGWSHRCVVDDAFVDFRVVDFLLHGRGPVFNMTERVEAYSNPLWVGLLALFGALTRPFVHAKPPLEWISVILGVAAAALGLACAGLATRSLARRVAPDAIVLPLGSLVVLAVSPFWDFSSCGLETGLIFCWLGASMLGLARLESGGAGSGATMAIAALLGVGPLVRPDLGIFAVCFLACLLALTRPRWWIRSLLAAAAIPLVYEVFRMGYFAALVPNTALAKEAFHADWSAGLQYLRDFIEPYGLRYPIAILFLAAGLTIGRLLVAGRPRTALVLFTPLFAGLVYGLFVVRVGGDFMHARFLLPALFALALPVATVSVSGLANWLVVPLLPWALSCGLWFRVPYATGNDGEPLISYERGLATENAGRADPVAVKDFLPNHPWAVDGTQLEELARGGPPPRIETEPKAGAVVGEGGNVYKALFNPWVLADVIAWRRGVGIIGYAAGIKVHICDALGLGDAFAARLRREERGERIGHRKMLGGDWCLARLLAPGDVPEGADEAALRAANHKLHRPDLQELQAAITGPLTAARFWSNLWLARRLSNLRFSDEDENEGRPELARCKHGVCPAGVASPFDDCFGLGACPAGTHCVFADARECQIPCDDLLDCGAPCYSIPDAGCFRVMVPQEPSCLSAEEAAGKEDFPVPSEDRAPGCPPEHPPNCAPLRLPGQPCKWICGTCPANLRNPLESTR